MFTENLNLSAGLRMSGQHKDKLRKITEFPLQYLRIKHVKTATHLKQRLQNKAASVWLTGQRSQTGEQTWAADIQWKKLTHTIATRHTEQGKTNSSVDRWTWELKI